MKLTRPTPRKPLARDHRRYVGPVQVWIDGGVRDGQLTWTTHDTGVPMSRLRPTLLLDDGTERGRHECAWLRYLSDPVDVRQGDWIDRDGIAVLVVEIRVDGLGAATVLDDDGDLHVLARGEVVHRYDRNPAELLPEPVERPADPFEGLPGA